VYSLGQVGWQLLVGRRPVGNTPPLGQLRPDLSPQLVAFVEHLREDDDSERPLDAGVALTEMRQLRDILVKPALRRGSRRKDPHGEPVHNELSASTLAIQARQMDGLEELARLRGSAEVIWALDVLLHRLGPLRFEEGKGRATIVGEPLWLSSGSLRVSVSSNRLLTLDNRVTGQTLSFALDAPHAIQEVPWNEVVEELHDLDRWDPVERARFFRIFSAQMFTSGLPCGVCWSTTGSTLRLMRRVHRDGRSELFRAAICSQHGPGDDYLCCICGNPFRRAGSNDEWGLYDAVGCSCPGYAFEVEFDEQPWKEGEILTGLTAVELFESR
jgi:hypothetical protein